MTVSRSDPLVALIGLGGDRLGDTSLGFAPGYPQPPREHVGPRSPAEYRGVALGDKLSDQSPVNRHPVLVQFFQSGQKGMLFRTGQRLQRKRGDSSVAVFDRVQRRDDQFLIRTHVRIISSQSDT